MFKASKQADRPDVQMGGRVEELDVPGDGCGGGSDGGGDMGSSSLVEKTGMRGRWAG